MADLTMEIAEFVSGTRYSSLSQGTVHATKRSILDTVGVTIQGSDEPAARLVQDLVTPTSSPTEARVLGTALHCSPQEAALANGVAAHVLEYDDTQLSPSPDVVYGLLMHPTAPILSGALALAQQNDVSGQELITAVAVGVEAACKLAEAVDARLYLQGLHCTGTVGSIGSAAAAARILDLGPDETAIALSIGASEAAGLRVNFGTMTKSLHSGRAAQSGVVAALLAEQGFTASPRGLEAEAGFIAATAGGYSPDRVHGKLGNPFTVEEPGLALKRYPCGTFAAPAMDLAFELVSELDLGPEDIAGVRVGVNSMAQRGLFYTVPGDRIEARYSIPYCVAVMIAERSAGPAQFSDSRVADPEIQGLLHRIEVNIDDEAESLGYDRMFTRLTIDLADGRTVERTVDVPRGHPEKPLSDTEVRAKFSECAGGIFDGEQIEAIADETMHLEQTERLADWALIA